MAQTNKKNKSGSSNKKNQNNKPKETKVKKSSTSKKTTKNVKGSASKKEAKIQTSKKKISKNNNNIYKILIFVGVVLAIVLLSLIVYMMQNSNMENTDKPNSNKNIYNNSQTQQQNSNSNNQDMKSSQNVELLIIEDPNCTNCQVDLFAKQIKDNLLPNLNVKKINGISKEGANIVNSLKLKTVPIYLFSKEIAQRDDWKSKLEPAFIKVNVLNKDYYMLNPQYVPNKYLLGDIPVSNSNVIIGNKNAKVTIYEFSDYECPFCAIAENNSEMVNKFRIQAPNYQPPIPLIIKNYVETGKVKLIFFNFPLESIHKKARDAHNAALCANEQEKWLDYNEKLFQNRNDWINSNDEMSIFIGFAKELNLNEKQFEECLNSKKYNSQIDSDIKTGIELGVSGTPTFFINKNYISGAQDYKTFKAIIDSELEKVNG